MLLSEQALEHTFGYAAYASSCSYFCAIRVEQPFLDVATLDCGCPAETFFAVCFPDLHESRLLKLTT